MIRPLVLLLLLLLLALATAAACSSPEREEAPGEQDDAGTPSDPSAPRFLAFGTDLTALSRGQSVTFTAVLTDPDGIDDLIGGSLLSDEGQHYGAFTSSAQEGAYSLTVSWAQMNRVKPITFTGSTSTRGFVAQFYDVAGHQAARTASIDLSCPEGGACDGTCISLGTDEDNCGSCGNRCISPDDEGGRCDSGACVFLHQPNFASETCDETCAAHGLDCAAVCESPEGPFARETLYEGNLHVFETTCSAPAALTYQGSNLVWTVCCCQ